MEALTVQSSEKEWVITIDKDKPMSKEILLELAILLYRRELISLGKAANLAGLHRMEFQVELDKRHIDLNYSVEDFEREMENIKSLQV